MRKLISFDFDKIWNNQTLPLEIKAEHLYSFMDSFMEEDEINSDYLLSSIIYFLKKQERDKASYLFMKSHFSIEYFYDLIKENI